MEEADPPGECGKWPCEVVWPDEAGERHLYRFKGVALTPSGVPVYEFVRTLDPDEPDL